MNPNPFWASKNFTVPDFLLKFRRLGANEAFATNLNKEAESILQVAYNIIILCGTGPDFVTAILILRSTINIIVDYLFSERDILHT